MAGVPIPQAFDSAVRLQQAGRLAEAETIYRQILRARPEIVEVHNQLGTNLLLQGRRDEAAAAFRHALAMRPRYAEARCNLGNTLWQSGDVRGAIAQLEQAVALKPDFPEAWTNLGNALADAHRYDQAEVAYRRAVALRPDWPMAYFNLANALRDALKLDAAIDAYAATLELDPRYFEARHNLAGVRKEIGQLNEALLDYQRALAIGPNPMTAGNLIYTTHFHPDYDARRIYEAHANWNDRYARPLAPMRLDFPGTREPGRRLRIGYVSPDLREHPVGRFLLPLLSHHDHAAFEVVCYTDVRHTDALTETLKRNADVWRATAGLSDEQLAALVREDGVDILVDLTMHMRGSRMLTFARKPAPVQVTYLAYASTTGLRTIDYRLSDPYLDPPDVDTSVYSEATFRLPRTYWCYPRPDAAPAVAPPPALTSGGGVTFGCLNNYCKVSTETWSMWTDLLARVPSSRLIVHAPEGRHRQAARDRLAAAGIDPARLEFVGLLPLDQYLAQYHRIDVALDPFPYGGGTTTCDALYMGVPVVTLRGETAVSRGGLSILSNLGFPQWVASHRDAYLSVAAHLASDLPGLASIRSELRGRMESSPLMDAPQFARDVEAAFREMWARWCAWGPAGSARGLPSRG